MESKLSRSEQILKALENSEFFVYTPPSSNVFNNMNWDTPEEEKERKLLGMIVGGLIDLREDKKTLEEILTRFDPDGLDQVP